MSRLAGGILVTGGAGLIGSALVWHLNRSGYTDIVVVDRLRTTEKWKNLCALRFNDYFDVAQIEPELCAGRWPFPEVRTVFHLGACSATTETDASYLVRNNYQFSKTLARLATAQGCRFVYASSAATYGALETGLSESRPLAGLRPLNMYGYSKHLFDLWADRNGLLEHIVGLKYFNVFGPNEDHKGDMRSVVHKGFREIQNTGRLSLFKSYRPEFADGGQRRDFVYVKDAVAATLFLAESGAAGLYNIGSGRAQSWLELGDALFAALGKPPQIEFIPMPPALRPKYQYFTCAETAKLRNSGFDRPFTPLPEAIADYVQTYLLHARKLGDEHPVDFASDEKRA